MRAVPTYKKLSCAKEIASKEGFGYYALKAMPRAQHDEKKE